MYLRTMYGPSGERRGQETRPDFGSINDDAFHQVDNPAVSVCVEKLDGSSEVWTYVREPEETEDVPDTLELAQALVNVADSIQPDGRLSLDFLHQLRDDPAFWDQIDQCRRLLS